MSVKVTNKGSAFYGLVGRVVAREKSKRDESIELNVVEFDVVEVDKLGNKTNVKRQKRLRDDELETMPDEG